MRRKTHLYILFVALLAVLAGCEKEIDFKDKQESGIAVYALAAPGQPFTMRVSRSFAVNDHPTVVFTSLQYSSVLDTLLRTVAVIPDAQAVVTVNGTDKYTMAYDPSPRQYLYTCDYVPREGDDITVDVSAPGYRDISASAHINNSNKIEILNTQVVYKDNGYDGSATITNPLDIYGVDSVMQITLRINDPAGEHNFYRLRVCGVAIRDEYAFSDTIPFYRIGDVFSSDDIIFQDNMLAKPYGDWPAGFSNVFDDHLFDGQQYVFTVETRKRYGYNPHVILELETLTPDFYYFLKSVMVFRISTDDVYLTPIGLYSNITDGWGILGAVSYDRHLIYY